MKKLTLLIFFLCFYLFPQAHKFAWLTDLHVGSPTGILDLTVAINSINNNPDIDFVVITGDITEKGTNAELDSANSILSSLNVPFYIIPGNHDTKWSESGLRKFVELFKDEKFVFENDNFVHIGINSGIPWRGGGGHIFQSDINWVKEQLDRHKDKIILFYVHHPLDKEIDNWYKLVNVLNDYNVQNIFVGHGHKNLKLEFGSLTGNMGRSTLNRNSSWGYNIVFIDGDSLTISEVDKDGPHPYWTSVNLKKEIKNIDTDSSDFINYNANILWQKDTQTPLSASLLFINNKLYSASIDGEVSCFNLSGELVWKNKLNRRIFSKPAGNKEHLFVGTINGELFVLNAQNGNTIISKDLNEPITSQLIINQDKLFLGSSKGTLYCLNIKDLSTVWENRNSISMIESKPIIVENNVIFGSWDNYLHCLDIETGSEKWKWSENKNFYYSPAAAIPVTDGAYVYMVTPDKFTSKISLTGETIWRKEDFKSWESIGISEDKKYLFIKSYENSFYIVDLENENKYDKINIGFGIDTMPIEIFDNNSNIVFGTKNGTVYKINKDNTFEKVLFLGTSRIHTILNIGINMFAASNMDGKIVLFEVK